jgi:hypothetical protein
MSDLLFYNSYDIFFNPKNKSKLDFIPGGEAFSSYFEIFSKNISAVDRTKIITTPLKTKVLDFLVMPTYEKFNKTFEEVCDERAKFLLSQAKHTNKKLAILYSGGVDSTLILCSLLKNAKPDELSNIYVFLSDESIRENTSFYYNFVIKKFKCFSSYKYPQLLGRDDYLFVTGENADQLFGSQLNETFIKTYSIDDVFKDYVDQQGQMLDIFNLVLSDRNKKYKELVMSIFTKLVKSSEIELKNVYQFHWWLNFTTKWQSVYMRILAYTLNKQTLKLQENYTTFYHTKEFSLWALNNFQSFSTDPTMMGRSISKQYIFDVDGNTNYLKKPKMYSLHNLVRNKQAICTINDSLHFSDEYPGEEYYNFENDFIE